MSVEFLKAKYDEELNKLQSIESEIIKAKEFVNKAADEKLLLLGKLQAYQELIDVFAQAEKIKNEIDNDVNEEEVNKIDE